jgi:5'-3' exonuclease
VSPTGSQSAAIAPDPVADPAADPAAALAAGSAAGQVVDLRHADPGSAPGHPTPLLLAVDGNSLLHRAFHAMSGNDLRDDAGRPVWALKGMLSFLATAAARLTPDAVVIGFDCPQSSVRRDDYPPYKAHRVPKPDDLTQQLATAPRLLAEAGFCVVTPAGYEADDVLASAARAARDQGFRATVMTSDRDSFALIDGNTSVLRVLNGGIDLSPVLTPATLPLVCGVTADQYRDFAALRGDTSDNLPGVMGIGAKTAAGLLARFASLDDVYAALDSGGEADVIAAIGPSATAKLTAGTARDDVRRNRRLMTMRRDLDLPALDAMRLPLDPVAVQRALRSRQIHLGPSLWALVGGSPPEWLALRQGHWSGSEPDTSGIAGLGGEPRDPLAVAQADRVLRNRPPATTARSTTGRLAVSEDQLSLF